MAHDEPGRDIVVWSEAPKPDPALVPWAQLEAEMPPFPAAREKAPAMREAFALKREEIRRAFPGADIW